MRLNVTCPDCGDAFPIEVQLTVGSKPSDTNRAAQNVTVKADITDTGRDSIQAHMDAHSG